MAKKRIQEGLTFDDVLLKPQYSQVDSRRQVSLKTKISPHITLNLPIISANMDTVTESAMAIAMARAGGLGIIHRFLPIEKEVEEVQKVKRAENFVVEEPFVVEPNFTLRKVKELSKKHDVQTFVVVNKERKVLGILTKRDYLFEKDETKLVKELMTPRSRLIVADRGTSLEKAQEIFKKNKVEKLPLVDKNDCLLGLITAKDILNHLNSLAVRDKKGRLMVGAAVGIKDDYLERAQELVKAEVDLLVVDVAHGHLDACLKAVQTLKKRFPHIDLMAGNVATKEGALDLKRAGADSIKVGVGGGSVCLTRIKTGAGVPQLSAVFEAKKGAGETPIISDGGIRNSGDIVKALAAGASAVMVGMLLAGTDESPGEVINWNDKRVKIYRGMASFGAKMEREAKIKRSSVENFSMTDFVSEGADQVFIPYRGRVEEILSQLAGGIRSGFSYCGAKDLKELWQKAEFIKITGAGLRESGLHDVFLAN